MPEHGGESSDRGWRYAIFFFSPPHRRASSPIPSRLSLSLSFARHCTPPTTLPQFFFSVQSNGKHFGDELRSLLSESACIRGINVNSCRAYFALSRWESERENDVWDISLYRGTRRGSSHLWMLRCLFCAMQNSIRHEIVSKQVEPESRTLIYRESEDRNETHHPASLQFRSSLCTLCANFLSEFA